MTLEEIKRDSPKVKGRGDIQTVFYSVHCVWWTSFPEDLGSKRAGQDDLPCCPHCGSMLFEGDLEGFLENAEANTRHYGPLGLQALVAAHHRNGARGYSWDEITAQLLTQGQSPPRGQA